jgi:phosphotransferase system  glucose/maltose/N-acetylglucosamine-specific IIC component
MKGLKNMTAQKKRNQRKGVNPIFAAVTGAMVGAGAAIAGAVVLKDKKNRDKVKKALTSAKDHAVGYMGKMEKQIKAKKRRLAKK